MKRITSLSGLAACVLAGGAVLLTFADEPSKKPGYRDTPMLPGGKWHVHDSERPQPAVVTPGTSSTPETPGKAPSDAVVLFDGTDLSKWESGKGKPADWKVENGYAEVPPKGEDIRTKESFGDCQLHVEWSAPVPPSGDSQDRGNSGVFFMSIYEIQVLDCYNNLSYPDGSTASLYGQYPPLVNACRPPGEWQTYDILFTAPRFKGGEVETPAYVTVIHNGVVVHNHTALLGGTGHRILPKYTPHGPTGPIRLQCHHNPVRYRNIWVRTLKGYDEP